MCVSLGGEPQEADNSFFSLCLCRFRPLFNSGSYFRDPQMMRMEGSSTSPGPSAGTAWAGDGDAKVRGFPNDKYFSYELGFSPRPELKN